MLYDVYSFPKPKLCQMPEVTLCVGTTQEGSRDAPAPEVMKDPAPVHGGPDCFGFCCVACRRVLEDI